MTALFVAESYLYKTSADPYDGRGGPCVLGVARSPQFGEQPLKDMTLAVFRQSMYRQPYLKIVPVLLLPHQASELVEFYGVSFDKAKFGVPGGLHDLMEDDFGKIHHL